MSLQTVFEGDVAKVTKQILVGTEGAPVEDSELANKEYVDDSVNSIEHWLRDGGSATIYPRVPGDKVAGGLTVGGNFEIETTLDATKGDLTLTSAKTIISNNFQLASSTVVDAILDEDNMVSDSATALATQQSIKKYVDDEVATAGVWDKSGDNVTIVGGDSSTLIEVDNITNISGSSTVDINGSLFALNNDRVAVGTVSTVAGNYTLSVQSNNVTFPGGTYAGGSIGGVAIGWRTDSGGFSTIEGQNNVFGVIKELFLNGKSTIVPVFIPSAFNNAHVGGRVMMVIAGGEIGYDSSCLAHKKNIEDLDNVDWIYDLKPRKYNARCKKKIIDENTGEMTGQEWLDECSPVLNYGLIAEEVELIAPICCFYDYDENDEKTNLSGVSYQNINIALLKIVQQQKALITALESRVTALEALHP